jgi:hypothetical protein
MEWRQQNERNHRKWKIGKPNEYNILNETRILQALKIR